MASVNEPGSKWAAKLWGRLWRLEEGTDLAQSVFWEPTRGAIQKTIFYLLLVMLKWFQMYCVCRLPLELWQGAHKDKSTSSANEENDSSYMKST